MEEMIKQYLEHHFEPRPNGDFKMEPIRTRQSMRIQTFRPQPQPARVFLIGLGSFSFIRGRDQR
jgi:hypothetical protein